jgi:hypothetical protein
MATPAKRLFRPLSSPARPSRPATSPHVSTATANCHAALPGRPAPRQDLPRPGSRSRSPGQRRALVGREGLPSLPPVRHPRPRVREGSVRGLRSRATDPFSCKGRGICPSCNTRRMAELAAHLTDHVLPHLAARQWALSLPKRLRPFLHHNPDIAGAVLRIFLRAIRTTLRHVSPGAPAHARLGAVSFLHGIEYQSAKSR